MQEHIGGVVPVDRLSASTTSPTPPSSVKDINMICARER